MRRARASILIATLGGGALVAAGGCAGIFGIDDLSSSAFDAGAEAAVEMDANVVDATPAVDVFVDAGIDSPCGRVGVPDKPVADSPPQDGGDVTFIVALDSMDFGIPPDGGGAPIPVGFNLDKFCTVSSAGGSSCTTMTSATNFSQYVADKNAAGLDNAGFDLIKYLTTLGDAFKPENVNTRLQSGQFSGVLVVSGYNGGPNDTSIDLNFFPAYALTGAAGNTPVTFGPSDVWLTDENAYVPGTSSSIYHSNAAYVTNGTLVAQFATLAFAMSVSDPDPRLVLALNEVVATADIVPATGSTSAYRLTNGILAGRWKMQTFFSAVGPLTYGSSAICTQSVAFDYLKSQVCGARDIMSNGTDDNAGKACDAVSAGMAFDTYAVDTIAKGTAPSSDAGCGNTGDCP